MGIIARQGFIISLIFYVGFVLSFINSLYIKPLNFSLEELGIFNLYFSNAMLFSVFLSFGLTGTVLKYNPYFQKKGIANTQFFSFVLFLLMLSLLAVMVILIVNYDLIYNYIQQSSLLFERYFFYSIVFIFLNVIFGHFLILYKSNLKSVLPNLFQSIIFKIFIIGIIIGYGLELWTFSFVMLSVLIIYTLGTVVLIIDYYKKYKTKFTFNWSGINNYYKKKILLFSGFSLLMGFGITMMNTVSFYQVTNLLGDYWNGIFSTCFFISTIVDFAKVGISMSSDTLISQATLENNKTDIKNIYQKSSIALAAFGILYTIIITLNIPDLFSLVPQGDKFMEGYFVIVLLTLTKTISITFSMSGEIIIFSKFNRFILYIHYIFVVVLMGLNYFLIPKYGILGAGISFAFSYTAMRICQFLFVKQKFRMSPFTWAHVKLLIVSFLIFFGIWVLPLSFHPILNICIRILLISALYIPAVYYLNISPDINRFFINLLKKIFKFLSFKTQ